MAIKQTIQVPLQLVGDGTSTTFAYAISNLYQSANGYSLPFGSAGVVPSSVSVTGSSEPVTSATVDVNGNVTITFTTAPANGEIVTAILNVIWNSGAAVSASPTQTALVTLSGTSTVTVSGTSAVNLSQLNGVALGSPSNYGTSPGAVSVQGVNAFITNTVPVTLTSTTITGTVAVTQSTSPWVVAGGLTHNNAAPAANNVGVLPAVASTAAPTYTTGDQVLLSTDLAGNLRVTFAAAGETNVNLNQWASAALGPPANYGTSPGAVVAGSVNAFVTNTVATTLTSTTITGTVAVTQSTSPWTIQGDSASGAANAGNPVKIGGVFNTTQPTVTNGQTVDAQTTARGAQIVATGVDGFNVTNAGTFAVQVTGTVAVTQSTSPWVVSLTSTTITGTVAVTQSGTWTVQQGGAPWSQVGTLTHNNAAPAANNVGALVAVASTAAPTYTTGDQVLLSTDLAGNLRVSSAGGTQSSNIIQWNSVALGSPSAYGTSPGAVSVIGVNAFVTNTVPVTLTSTTITGTVAVTQSTSPWVVNMTQWGGTALGTPTNFGTTPGAVVAASVNSSVFIGTTVAVAASAGVQKVGISGATGAAMDVAIGGATAAANALQVGGVFNTTQPTLTSGQGGALQVDNRGNLLVNTLAGSLVASAVGTNAMQTGLNVGGTLRIWTGVNPTGTVYAGQVDITSVAGTTAVTAAAGVLKVGIVGSANATLDSTVGSGTAPTNALATSGLYNTTQPAPTNGQATAAQQDQAANSLQMPGVQFKQGAAWSSATALNTLQYITGTTTIGQPSGAPGVVIQFNQTTTLTAGAVTFQGTYDNVNWITIPVAQVLNPQTLAPLTNPMTFTASTQTPVLITTQGFISVRINLTTAITGTGTVTPFWGTQAIAPLISTVVTPSSSGGVSVATGSIGATKTAVKTSAGSIFGWYFYNSNSAAAYVQIFANTTAGVTLGTTAPTLSLGVPPGSAANMAFDIGVSLATAITIAITTTRAGATGPTNTVDYNIFYL